MDTPPPHPDLRAQFLSGMSYAAATVSVVTTDGAAGRRGVTVSAMASVSADGPRPTLLICVHRDSATAAAIMENRVFCVNVLSDRQAAISDVFAGRQSESGEDKFACAHWSAMPSGAWRLTDPLVAFDCRLVSSDLVATHYVFFGEVGDIFVAGAGSPLIYARRDYAAAQRLAGPAETEIRRTLAASAPGAGPGQADTVIARGRSVFLRGSGPVGQSTEPAAQTRAAMQRIRERLDEAGGAMTDLVRLVVYVTDVGHRAAVHAEIAASLEGAPPVVTDLTVAGLSAPDQMVEIDATAVIPDGPDPETKV